MAKSSCKILRGAVPLRQFSSAAPMASLLIILVLLFASQTFAVTGKPGVPLVVNQQSHVVIMEYEAWFGPNAVTFAGTAAKPLLQSADMQALGGGYDSADPAVIQQHVAWLESMGLDGVTIDLTNNVSCIFNSDEFVKKYVPNCSPAFRSNNRSIRNNTGNLYPAWTALNTPLKLIPLLGGIDNNVLIKDTDGTTALEKEINYFGARMKKYPGLNITYEGKPLMLIFLGAGQDPDLAHHPLWYEIRRFLKKHPDLTRQYTFKEIAGYLDSQPYLWKTQGTPNGPQQISPQYAFWSVVDRQNTTCTEPLCPYYPTYNKAGNRVENFTVSIDTAGQNGWDCGTPRDHVYCSDDSLRYGSGDQYVTFEAFMQYAQQLQPIFLIVDQFNEYVHPDEGWNANTDDDTEPANLWGYSGLNTVRREIKAYRKAIAATSAAESTPLQ